MLLLSILNTLGPKYCCTSYVIYMQPNLSTLCEWPLVVWDSRWKLYAFFESSTACVTGQLCFQVRKLDAMFDAVTSAINLCGKSQGFCTSEQTPCLEGKICSYFQEGDTYDTPNKMNQSRYVQSLFLIYY